MDGFYEIVPLEVIRSDERVMLAYAWDGVPLAAGHGFPLRIYIPDVYGMKQPKWIESIEATDRWEPGYWVVRGWDKIARMKATVGHRHRRGQYDHDRRRAGQIARAHRRDRTRRRPRHLEGRTAGR